MNGTPHPTFLCAKSMWYVDMKCKVMVARMALTLPICAECCRYLYQDVHIDVDNTQVTRPSPVAIPATVLSAGGTARERGAI